MRIFISYSHKSDLAGQIDVTDQVYEFASWLKSFEQLQVVIDKDQYASNIDWRDWPRKQIEQSDVVIVIFSESYCHKWCNGRTEDEGSGAGYEARMISNECLDKPRHSLNKYIFAILGEYADEKKNIPLEHITNTFYNIDSQLDRRKLLRSLADRLPEIEKNGLLSMANLLQLGDKSTTVSISGFGGPIIHKINFEEFDTPSYLLPVIESVKILCDLGSYDEAGTLIEHTGELTEEDRTSLRAIILRRKGEPDKAESVYEQLHHQTGEPRYALSRIALLTVQGDWNRADALLQSLDRYSSLPFYKIINLSIAVHLDDARRFMAAIRSLSRLERNRFKSDFWCFFGLFASSFDKHRLVSRCYAKAAAGSASNAPIYQISQAFHLALASSRNDDPLIADANRILAEATSRFKPSMVPDPEDIDDFESYLCATTSIVKFVSGNLGEAISVLNTRLNQHPGDTRCRNQLYTIEFSTSGERMTLEEHIQFARDYGHEKAWKNLLFRVFVEALNQGNESDSETEVQLLDEFESLFPKSRSSEVFRSALKGLNDQLSAIDELRLFVVSDDLDLESRIVSLNFLILVCVILNATDRLEEISAIAVESGTLNANAITNFFRYFLARLQRERSEVIKMKILGLLHQVGACIARDRKRLISNSSECISNLGFMVFRCCRAIGMDRLFSDIDLEVKDVLSIEDHRTFLSGASEAMI